MTEHDSPRDAASPETALDADEPQTPFWLTLLGGALFLAAALFLLAGGEDEATEEPSPADPAAAAQGAAEAD